MAAPGDVSRAGTVARRRSRRSRNNFPKITRQQVARAGASSRASRSAQRAHVSQGAQVAHSAYLANPVRARRSEVRQARSTPSAQRTGGQHLLLGTHGQRTSARGRKRAALARQKQAAQTQYTTNTPRVRTDIHDLTKPFKGFRDYEKRALKGDTTKVEQAEAARVMAAGARPPAWFRGARSGTLFALDQLMRPSSATGAAMLKRERGGSNVGDRARAFVQGFLHPKSHSGDWVKAAREGHWPVPTLTGTAASIAADPTTYLTFGAGSPAKAAAMKVYAEHVAAGAARHEAVGAARAVWEAAPAHMKVPGLKVGVSGAPARAVGRRRLETAPSNLGVGRLAAATKKAGLAPSDVRPMGLEGGAIRKAARTVIPSIRPKHVDPVTWEFIQRGGTSGRAGERTAQRMAEHRLHAYHGATKGMAPERDLAIRVAVEDAPHVSTPAERAQVWKQHGLSDAEKQVAEEMAIERVAQYATEPGRVPLTAESRVGAAAPPVRPAYEGSDVAASKRVLEKAERRMAAATRAKGEEKGRRAVLGWRIGQQRTKSLGQERAAQEIQDAAEHLKGARASHRAETGKAARDRKAYREHVRAVQSFSRMPKGYVFTPAKEGEFIRPGGSGVGGKRVGGPTYQQRSQPALANLSEEQLSRRDLRIPVTQAQRALQHGRILAAADLNHWIGSLGKQITHDDVRDLVGSDRRVFVQDDRGFKPLFDKTGKVDAEAVDHAITHGQKVVEVDPQVDEMVRSLARGNRERRAGSPFDPEGKFDEGLFRKGTRHMKWAQTQINPAYHIRNFVGDAYNAGIAGTSATDVARSIRMLDAHAKNRRLERVLSTTPEGKKAYAALQKVKSRGESHYPKLGKKTDLEVVALAAEHGAIDTGITRGELLAATQGTDVSNLTRRARAREGIGRANDARENIIRLATFRSALKRGMTPDEAAQWSLTHHFDYSNLSRGEQEFARTIFPFWTFMARNTVLQAKSLVTRPGVPATVEKARRGTLQAAGYDANYSQGQEPFEQTNLPWALPFMAGRGESRGRLTAAPALPLMDLSNIPVGINADQRKQAASNIFGRSHPIVSAGLFGVGAGLNALNFRELPAYQPAPNWGGLEKKLPGYTLTRDPRSGAARGSVPPATMAALNVIPALNLSTKAGVSGNPGQPSPFALRALGWATGPRYAVENQHSRAITQNFDRIDQIDAELRRIEPRALQHKTGEDWGGRVRKLLDEKNEKMHEIYKHSVALGHKNPLGTPPPKGRHNKSHAKIPGGLGSGSFGGNGFSGGGFGG